MTEFKPSKEIKLLICETLGEDIDNPVCDELSRYMDDCPDCKMMFDSVKKIVKFYCVNEKEKDLPEDVSKRLFKVLDLNFQKSNNPNQS